MFRFVFIFIDDDSFSQWWKCGSARCCLASSSARKLRWTIVIIVIVSSSLSSLYHCILSSSSSCGLIRCSGHGRGRELKWKLFATQSSRSGSFIFHRRHHVRINIMNIIICILWWWWSLSSQLQEGATMLCGQSKGEEHLNCERWWVLDDFEIILDDF